MIEKMKPKIQNAIVTCNKGKDQGRLGYRNMAGQSEELLNEIISYGEARIRADWDLVLIGISGQSGNVTLQECGNRVI